jgi:hemerythrin-like domain-containing protein
MLEAFSLSSLVGAGGLAVAALLVPAVVLGAGAARPTESFRQEHVEIRAHLDHVRDWTGNLMQQAPDEQRKTARRIVAFFEEHIQPHAGWEEKALYPLVDRLAGGGEHPFTATMRHEHRIVERWIGELAREVAKPRPDYRAFARRTDNLLGLITAHFEEEEDVLLPLIDRSLTAEQFKKELGGAAAHP